MDDKPLHTWGSREIAGPTYASNAWKHPPAKRKRRLMAGWWILPAVMMGACVWVDAIFFGGKLAGWW